MTVADTDPGFDTLAYARLLKDAGVGEKQAEAHAEAARNARAGLATKADLDAGLSGLETRLEARLDARMIGLETRLNARFDESISRLEARMNGLEARVASLEARMDRLEERMDRLEARMERLEERVSGVETRMLRVAIGIVLAQTALTAGLTVGLLRLFGAA